MYSFKRVDRVSELISEEVSKIIQFELKDPRLGLVTVTGVEMGSDLRNAKIYISVHGGKEDVERSIQILTGASGFIRKEIGKRVRLKYIPKLTFQWDKSTDYAMHIEELLKQIKEDQNI